MSMISVDYDVLNQRGSPAWFSDTYANIPTAGYKGRMFISIDTFAFYRDTGTGWDLIGGPGTGTITGSGVSGQVSYFNGSSTLAGSNNLFWDNTNARLGINNSTPTNSLDVIGTGKFTGVLTLGSTISNGTNSYTLPSATGTIAILEAGTQTFTGTLNVLGSLGTKYGISIEKGNTPSPLSANDIFIYASSGATNIINFANSSYKTTLSFPTSNQTYTFSASTGTLALTSDIPSNIVTGTGATGQVAYWSGSSTQAGNNNLFWDNTNARLGINTIVPNAGVTSFSTTASTQFKAAGTAAGITFTDTVLSPSYNAAIGIATAVNNFVIGTAIGDMGIVNQSTTPGAIVFGIGSLNEKGRFSSSGNFLLGSATDSGYKLDVTGTGRFTSTLLVSGNVGINGSSTTSPLSVKVATNQNVRISSETSTAIQAVNDAASAYVALKVDGLSLLLNSQSGGNVGINITAPPTTFSVKGSPSVPTAATYNGIFGLETAGQTSFQMGINTNGNGTWFQTYNQPATGGGTFSIFLNPLGGNVAIGLQGTISYQLQLSTDSAAKPTTALWTIASDIRIKENINTYNLGLKELLKINPITYDYNGLGGFTKGKGGVGIIAQEIIEILPNSVSSIKNKLNETDEQETDILNFNGHELIYVLINSVKELNEKLVRNNIN